MNIFEASKLSGRICLQHGVMWASKGLDNKFYWHNSYWDNHEVCINDLCRNDWIPYPPEKTKHKKEFKEVNFYKCASSGYIFPASPVFDFVQTLNKLEKRIRPVKMTLEWEE